jgi:ribosomal protein S18 acetylase RimI-like enzyme
MASRLQAILADPDFATFVAVVGDQVIGFIGTRVGPLYEGDGLHGQIMALAVAEDFRRQRIGHALMDAAEADLISRGAVVLTVNTGNHRRDAHSFYEGLGYEFTGRRYKKSPPASV